MSDHATPSATDDARLVARALAGDAEAIRAVDQRVRDAASSAAKRLAGDRAMADEIAQRVSEKLWTGESPVLRGFTGEAPLGAWLRVIAYRDGVDLRRAKEVPSDELLIERVVGTTEPALARLRTAYVVAFKRSFSAAFATLSLHDRDLVRRHHLDGLTLEQLAKLYDVHRATIARQLASVRSALVGATRDAMRSELSASTDLEEVLALIASKLEISLSRDA
ncbi:MAG TPA: sigma-70 family RNA polymerase sigma factor [Kofleriaceae bacterium]|jgi:RNA polymerase sigma-70 factor (ECF subfamily)